MVVWLFVVFYFNLVYRVLFVFVCLFVCVFVCFIVVVFKILLILFCWDLYVRSSVSLSVLFDTITFPRSLSVIAVCLSVCLSVQCTTDPRCIVSTVYH